MVPANFWNRRNEYGRTKTCFEVRIAIGDDSWESIRRAAREIADYIEEREPDNCGLSSGYYTGCHSIDLQRRDVTPEQYRKELEEWRQKQVAANRETRNE
jgi:hypothetical protein